MNTLKQACLMGSTILGLSTFSIAVQAQDMDIGNTNIDHSTMHHQHSGTSAPIGIMGDHNHEKGDWMVSYRFKHMSMNGNRQGTNGISPESIVTTVSNPNAPPANLRVVPTSMDMNMHMLGAMYGVTDKFTLMAMTMYMTKSMDHITFAGGAGTTRLGTFSARSSGWGDTSLSGLYKLYEDDTNTVNISLGISVPTGSIKEKDDVLAPTNATPTLRLPYAMQLGSGTWDALPSITYAGHDGKWGWGAQYNATIRMEGENSQGYRWGNKHELNLWGSYKISDKLSVNGLAHGETMGKIKGSDAAIAAPVQTADPDNYGGETLEIGAGFVYTPNITALKGLEFGANVNVPVYQDLNGVQMERDWSVMTGVTYRF
tara:strand:+ start:36235 stop:37350 length:1116 start_codon:yes stop_codon:yes gene_type:complete